MCLLLEALLLESLVLEQVHPQRCTFVIIAYAHIQWECKATCSLAVGGPAWGCRFQSFFFQPLWFKLSPGTSTRRSWRCQSCLLRFVGHLVVVLFILFFDAILDCSWFHFPFQLASKIYPTSNYPYEGPTTLQETKFKKRYSRERRYSSQWNIAADVLSW